MSFKLIEDREKYNEIVSEDSIYAANLAEVINKLRDKVEELENRIEVLEK